MSVGFHLMFWKCRDRLTTNTVGKSSKKGSNIMPVNVKKALKNLIKNKHLYYFENNNHKTRTDTMTEFMSKKERACG